MNKIKIIEILKKNNYFYKECLHEEIFTVEESLNFSSKIEGANTKNLFLKNKKNQFVLLSCLHSTTVNIKDFSKKNNFGGLSFANSNHLYRLLAVKPGSVSPFGLLNDKENIVNFFIDSLIINYKLVNFHPLINNSTISMNTDDFIDLMVANQKKVNIYNFETNTLVEQL